MPPAPQLHPLRALGPRRAPGRARALRAHPDPAPPAERTRAWIASLGLALLAACAGPSGPSGAERGVENTRVPSGSPAAGEPAADTASPARAPLGPITKGSMREHPAGVAWIHAPGREPRSVDIGEAEAEGHTVVDLSDDWTPFIFTEKTPGRDDAAPNGYRERYIGLANDEVDSDGRPLKSGAHNFLELYGIPPTLSVLQQEWRRVEAEVEPCLAEAGYDPEVFTRMDRGIAFQRGKSRRYLDSARSARARLRKVMRKAGLDADDPNDLAAAAEHPRTRAAYRAWRKKQDPLDVLIHANIRLSCERLYGSAGGRGTTRPGVYDGATHMALAAFEKKHDIKGWGHFTLENMKVFAMTPTEAVHARLLRVLEERVVSAAGILEDGSALEWKPDFRWTDEAGEAHPLPNLVDPARDALVEALGMETPAKARAALDGLLGRAERGEDGLAQILVAVKLPPLPAYYGDDMDLSAVIDRGDVWYDLPYDEAGNKVAQPRRRTPRLTLYVTYREQKIPLVHWRTTIGSWRSEVKDGEVYYRYKNSDVGPRVWKDIMAAPSWIPPESTPPEDLLKRRYVDGKLETVVNYDEMGPGFRSAYGLVAAYHIRQVFDSEGNLLRELDNQIRTHGSVDYMSIMRRYSHGCHRLYNMNAVRMFSFVLRHRDFTRVGDQPIGYRRLMEHQGKTYKIRIDTRGYKYTLAEPIPVRVTKGRIRGHRKEPYPDYVKKPGVVYRDDPPPEDPWGFPVEGPMSPAPQEPVPASGPWSSPPPQGP